ncbi:helix-turn-helix transcriptional regulator [Clostridium sp. MB40-C1]|uniref:helix-turn-helix transcriptional regulator n=1 Tax=Clostridium sp. MB40-C1 TaxID=3070996 RepID=UPI0027DF21AC|nr:helix-turn-helix transcriptional regulator [Clostridium sp. MB40-C1]WMJ82301.1 helix-turn-helix transcriptional regulator [Clostridium sp. MB40-C1]
MGKINLSSRQKEIIELVKKNGPITSEQLANKIGLSRAALRPDLAILTMTEILEARPKVGYIYANKTTSGLFNDYLKKIKIKDVMSKPITVDEQTTVYNAIVNLFLNDVGTIFVENKGCLVGAVSRKDFLKTAIGGTDINKVPIGIIMTRMPNIVYVEPEDSVYTAAKKIIDREVDSLPVVEKTSEKNEEKIKVIGKLSKTNITRLFVKMIEND